MSSSLQATGAQLLPYPQGDILPPIRSIINAFLGERIFTFPYGADANGPLAPDISSIAAIGIGYLDSCQKLPKTYPLLSRIFREENIDSTPTKQKDRADIAIRVYDVVTKRLERFKDGKAALEKTVISVTQGTRKLRRFPSAIELEYLLKLEMAYNLSCLFKEIGCHLPADTPGFEELQARLEQPGDLITQANEVRVYLQNLSGEPQNPLLEITKLELMRLDSPEILSALPEEIGCLSNLNYLNLDNHMVKILDELSPLLHLQYLDLNYSNLKSLKNTALPAFLITLTLSGNEIESLEEIVLPAQLQHLNLSENKLKSVKNVAFPSSLTSLSLSSNELESLEEMVDLPLLKVLQVINNKLTSLKDTSRFPLLEKLFADQNKIELLEDMPLLVHLEILNLYGNLIQSVAGIPCLPKLQTLDLTNNRLTSVRGLHPYSQLKTLLLSRNKLETFRGLPQLDSLKKIEAIKNPIHSLEGMNEGNIPSNELILDSVFLHIPEELLESQRLVNNRSIEQFKKEREFPAKTPLALLYQAILLDKPSSELQDRFATLTENQKKLIDESVHKIAGSPEETSWDKERCRFENMRRFEKAVLNSILTGVHRYRSSIEMQNKLAEHIFRLAHIEPNFYYLIKCYRDNITLLAEAFSLSTAENENNPS